MATPTSGWLSYGAVGEPLNLFEGTLALIKSDGSRAEQSGHVLLRWDRRPHLAWKVDTVSINSSDHRTWTLNPHDSDIQIELNVDGKQGLLDGFLLSFGEGSLHGGHVGNEADEVHRIVAHWINLPLLWPGEGLHHHDGRSEASWTGRWQISVGEWEITIDSRPDLLSVESAALAAESFVPTHVMQLRRYDDKAFRPADAIDLIHGLQYAFSFAVGYWTCPAIPVGLDKEGRFVWSEWRPLFADAPRRGSGWWPDQHADDLKDYVPKFLDHWRDPNKKRALKFAVTAAVTATETGFVEQRLMTAAAALEMLSWVSEVAEGHRTESSWYSKDAAWRIRKLMRLAILPLGISEALLPAAHAFSKVHALQDGPAVVAEVRHGVTHPKAADDLYTRKGLIAEASRLASRYLDIAILHRLGYEGVIADRTNLGRWAGDGMPAPWTTRSPHRP